jgi:glycerate 2-kinase
MTSTDTGNGGALDRSESAAAIAAAGIDAANAGDAVAQLLSSADGRRRLAGARRVLGLSLGKAAGEMDTALEAAVPPGRWGGGLVIGLAEHRFTYAGASPFHGGAHPLPDDTSAAAGHAARVLLAGAGLTQDDMVVVCVSGGASAMAGEPISPLTVGDLREATSRFLRSGLDVTAINTVRQAVTHLGGGGLASATWPARCWGLVLVDNVQVGVSAVGSGPTFSPLGDVFAARAIVERVSMPASLRQTLLAGIEAGARRIPRLGRTESIVIAGPGTALRGAVAAARAREYEVHVLSDVLQGEVRKVAKTLGAVCRHHAEAGRRVCVLAAGEVTVSIPEGCAGRGGRCQEFAWLMAPEIAGVPGAEFAAVASDGCDFLRGVGGARVTADTSRHLREAGVDWLAHLEAHDTFCPLKEVGALLEGRTTGTNVCDLYVFIAS